MSKIIKVLHFSEYLRCGSLIIEIPVVDFDDRAISYHQIHLLMTTNYDITSISEIFLTYILTHENSTSFIHALF